MSNTETDSKARVYVGTYAKYNAGSIAGKWLDLEDYADHDAFIEACHELHKDEEDPELMFQDYEGFPASYYGESSIKPELWDWLELDDDDKVILSLYADNIGEDATIEDAREAFAGTARSLEDWAEQFADDTGLLEKVPENLRYYFDWEKYARDLEIGGDIWTAEHDGDVYVFWNS